MSNIFIWVKKDLFGCFKIEEIRVNDNETGLKEGGGGEMSTTVLSLYIPSLCIYLGSFSVPSNLPLLLASSRMELLLRIDSTT